MMLHCGLSLHYISQKLGIGAEEVGEELGKYTYTGKEDALLPGTEVKD